MKTPHLVGDRCDKRVSSRSMLTLIISFFECCLPRPRRNSSKWECWWSELGGWSSSMNSIYAIRCRLYRRCGESHSSHKSVFCLTEKFETPKSELLLFLDLLSDTYRLMLDWIKPCVTDLHAPLPWIRFVIVTVSAYSEIIFRSHAVITTETTRDHWSLDQKEEREVKEDVRLHDPLAGKAIVFCGSCE